MPELPDAAFLTVRPDWLCEVLSPSTAQTDRVIKLPIYAREGVSHVWLVDPAIQTLEVFRLDGDTYRFITAERGDVTCRHEPFEEIELNLARLWAR